MLALVTLRDQSEMNPVVSDLTSFRIPKTPQVFHLYEVYEDDAAFEAHKQTPHFKIWRLKVGPWFDGEVQSVKMQTVFPSDGGWREQKSCLLNW